MEKTRSQVSLLVAAVAVSGLYYRQFLQVFIRNLRPTHPTSLLVAFRAVRSIRRVKDSTAVLPLRLGNLHRLARDIDVRSVRGDIVECGVYNGGPAALMASVCIRSAGRRGGREC